MSHSETVKDAVDVVLTWVDGNDPAHRAKMQKYRSGSAHTEATSTTRFDSSGEIYFAVASVLKNLPFVRTIWIVTDAQVPSQLQNFAAAGLCSADKIKVVDHKVILGDCADALPTFNSLTIEAALWRIPGLSNRYIYMNDDFMVLQPLTEDYFFDGNTPVIRGERFKPDHKRFRIKLRRFLRGITGRTPNTRPSYRISQERGAIETGETGDFIHVGHWPHPQLRDAQAEFHESHPEVLARQVRHRFRSVEQYNPVSLTNHLVAHGELGPAPKTAYIKPSSLARTKKATEGFFEVSCVFGCIQSLDEIDPDIRAELLTGLKHLMGKYLPVDIPVGPRENREDHTRSDT